MMQSKLFEDPTNIYGMLVKQEQKEANLAQRENFRNVFRMLRAEVQLLHINNN